MDLRCPRCALVVRDPSDCPGCGRSTHITREVGLAPAHPFPPALPPDDPAWADDVDVRRSPGGWFHPYQGLPILAWGQAALHLGGAMVLVGGVIIDRGRNDSALALLAGL